MDTKHSLAPWTTSGWLPTWAYIPVRYQGGLICSVYPAGRDVDYMEQAEANARLIAAAPELLEALILARKYVADLPIVGDADLTIVDAAIAKATQP